MDQLSDLSALVRPADEGTARPASRVPVPRSRWRTRVLLPSIIFLGTVALTAHSAVDLLWPAQDVRVAPVLVKEDMEAQPAGTVVVQAPGWVEADPFPIGVSALADGVVAEVLVLEGARVEAGQVVARLVEDDARIAWDHARASYAEREASLASAQAMLEEAQRNWAHPIQLTEAAQTAESRLAEKQAELARWPAELAREEAHLVYVKAEYDRVAPLPGQGHASDIELVQARQAYEAQVAQVEATRRREAILIAQIQTLEAQLRAAQQDLTLRIADTRALAEAQAAVQRTQAALASAKATRDDAALRLSRMEIRSPGDGVVMTRFVEPGSKLMLAMDSPHSAQVVRLYDPGKLQVRVDIPLVDAAKVGVGQEAEVVVDVLPDRVFRGKISRMVHEADVQKNTLQVKVAIEDPTPQIMPEMLARARFLSSTVISEQGSGPQSGQQLFAPRKAVVTRADGSFVWLADQVNGVALLREVTVSRVATGDWIAVKDGLRPGDRVIVHAPPGLKEGARIRPVGDDGM